MCKNTRVRRGTQQLEMWGLLALAGGGLGFSGCLSGTAAAGGGARLSAFKGCAGISAGFCSCVCKGSKMVNFVRRLVGDVVCDAMKAMSAHMRHSACKVCFHSHILR